MTGSEIVGAMRVKMEKTAEHFKSEITALRTGRATVSILDTIRVDFYGQMMGVDQIASLSVVPPNMIVIQPWDKNAIEPIHKAIMQSSLGIAPVVDKDVIRLVLPALSEERREGLIKVLNQKMEEAKISIRKEREDALKTGQKLKEDGELKEDDFFKLKNDIQKVVDEFNNEKLKSLRDKKEEEILKS